MTFWEIEVTGLKDGYGLTLTHNDDWTREEHLGEPVRVEADTKEQALEKFIGRLDIYEIRLTEFDRTIERCSENAPYWIGDIELWGDDE